MVAVRVECRKPVYKLLHYYCVTCRAHPFVAYTEDLQCSFCNFYSITSFIRHIQTLMFIVFALTVDITIKITSIFSTARPFIFLVCLRMSSTGQKVSTTLTSLPVSEIFL
uniref:Uncharacterized protein n=1 Tax=Rhipicephalus zambeziensis TaxID=60191 RepID=A0A224Y641_9ACAR